MGTRWGIDEEGDLPLWGWIVLGVVIVALIVAAVIWG